MIDNLDERIARAKARTNASTIPANPKNTYDRIEDGTDVLPAPSHAGVGQIDTSVPSAQSSEAIAAEREAAAARPPKPASVISMDFVPEPDSEIQVGNVVFRETHLVGWERVGTRDAGDYQLVTADGSVENSSHVIIKLLFVELKRLMLEKRKAGR
jgi:hypothetical protein